MNIVEAWQQWRCIRKHTFSRYYSDGRSLISIRKNNDLNMDLLEAPVLALLQLEPLLQSWENISRLFHILAQFPFTISE